VELTRHERDSAGLPPTHLLSGPAREAS
jgi:hypothetical protein